MYAPAEQPEAVNARANTVIAHLQCERKQSPEIVELTRKLMTLWREDKNLMLERDSRGVSGNS